MLLLLYESTVRVRGLAWDEGLLKKIIQLYALRWAWFGVQRHCRLLQLSNMHMQVQQIELRILRANHAA